jgi:type IV pilus assembly protein PilF
MTAVILSAEADTRDNNANHKDKPMHKDMPGRIWLIGSLLLTACHTQTIDPQLALINVQLGLHYFQHQAPQLAKQKLLLARQQAPRHPEVLAAWAYYYEQVGQTQSAARYYRQAIRYSRRGGKQLNNYAVFLCRQGNFASAEQYFLAATRDPNYINSALAYENAGLCAKKNGKLPQAKGYFVKALQHDPKRVTARRELQQLEDDYVHTSWF